MLCVQAAMQLSDNQIDGICRAYLTMMERFEEVSAAQQRMVASLSRPSRPGIEWMKDHVCSLVRSSELSPF